MEEYSRNPSEFLRLVKSFLSAQNPSKFPALTPVIQQLVEVCNDITAIKCVVSHLRAIRHYIKVKEGKSLYLRAVYSSELDRLIEEGEKVLGPMPFCWGGELQPPAKASIIERKDDYVREKKLEQEQFHLDDNHLFHNLLCSIWLYALERGFESKTIFISYAWPIGNVHEEAWTKAFVERFAYHLVSAGFQVYLDDIQGGAGFPLDEFMSKLKKCDHVLLISSRTMAEKLKKPESGVNQEKRKIIEHLEKQDSSFRERVVIPVLLNYSNYCDPLFASLAEVPMCVDGYLGSLSKLLPRLFGDSKERFEKWFDLQLKKEQVSLFKGVPHYSKKRIPREKLLLDIELKLKAKQVVVITGEAGTGKTELAVAYCHSTEAKQRYYQIFWIESGTKVTPEIPEGSLVVLNDIEDLLGCVKNLGLWGDVAVLITTREDCIGLSHVNVPAFNREEAIDCVEKFLWNKEVHKPELISALIEYAVVNPRKLREVIDDINCNKLNIPRYLRLHGQTGFDDAVVDIEILGPELHRGRRVEEMRVSEKNKDDKGKEEAIAEVGSLVFAPSEQMRPWNLPMRNPNFTGREKLLEELESRLTFRMLGSVNPVAITACEGMGGIGKTTLAIEFSHRYRARYRFVIWISAENEEQIREAYLALGQDLGILPEKVNPQEAVAIVKNYLSAKPGNLVIFDSGKYDDIKQFIPESGCSVLVPTRVEHGWPEKPVSVPLFSSDEARRYVRKILENRIDCRDEDIDALYQVLGGLPLAFAQAVAYIWMQKITIREYLALFAEVPVQLLSSGAMPTFDTHSSVYVTFDLAMKAISRQNPLAQKLLKLSTFVHHEEIPGFLFGGEGVEEALGLLSQYSLIMLNQAYRFSVHMLIQKVIKTSGLSSTAIMGYMDAVFDLLMKNFPYAQAEEQLKHVAIKRLLIPHLEAALLLWGLIESPHHETKLLLCLENAYMVLGNAYKRKQCLDRVLPLIKGLLGEEHHDVGALTMALGQVSGELGDAKKNVELHREALELFERKYGVDDPALLPMLNGLAMAVGSLGDHVEEKNLFERALSICEAHSTTDPKLRAVVLSNYGSVLQQFGDSQTARKFAENTLAFEEEYYEEEHPGLITGLHNLASDRAQSGDIDEAIRLLSRCLAIARRHYSDPHPVIGKCLLMFTCILKRAGRVSEAKIYGDQTLETFEKCYSADHPEVADVISYLEEIEEMLGNTERQKILLERGFLICRKYPNSDYPGMDGILRRFAGSFLELREFEKAIELFQYILARYTKLRIKDNPEMAKTFINFANCYTGLEQHEEAKKLLIRAYAIYKKFLGENHPLTAVAAYNLADASFSAATAHTPEYVKACVHKYDVASRSYEILCRHPETGPSHPFATKIAAFLQGMKHTVETVREMIPELRSTETLNEERAEEVITSASCSRHGFLEFNIGDFDSAIRNFNTALLLFDDKSECRAGELQSLWKSEHLRDVFLGDKLNFAVRPIFVAYCGLILCYRALNQVSNYEEILAKLRALVAETKESIYWKLLSILYKELNCDTEAEECEAMEFSLQLNSPTKSILKSSSIFWDQPYETVEDNIRLAIKHRRHCDQAGRKMFLEQALRLSSTHPAANYQMAQYLFEEKAYHEALPFLDTSLDNESSENKRITVHKLRARVYIALGNYVSAEEDALMAFSIDPEDKEVTELIGKITMANESQNSALETRNTK